MSARPNLHAAECRSAVPRPKPSTVRQVALASAVVALWGASFPLTKAVLGEIGPMGIAFVRWAISASVLTAWVVCRGRIAVAAAMARSDGLRLVWLSLTGIVLYYALQNIALTYTSATNGGILSNLVTVFIVLIAVMWYGERLRAFHWVALITAFAGATLVSQGAGHFALSSAGLRGDALMVLASIFAALYSVQSKAVTARYPVDVLAAAVALLGALLLLPLALGEGLRLALPAATWGALLLLGFGSGALANLWWLDLLAQMEAARAGMVLLVIPVFSTLVAVLLLHEPLTPIAAAGAVFVLAGVGIMQRKA